MAMHADEVATDADLVARLVADQFPRWAQLPIEPVASAGTDNALYRLGDDLVVRLPASKGRWRAWTRDHPWLPRLAPLLPVAIPVPLAKGAPAHGYPWHWSVYRWLDGENPTIDHHGDARCYGVGYVIRVEVAEVIAVGAAKVIGQEVAKVIAGIGPTTRGSVTRGRPN